MLLARSSEPLDQVLAPLLAKIAEHPPSSAPSSSDLQRSTREHLPSTSQTVAK
ncbi:hypothetical protein SMD44_00941 [Streptomyces alboflavus]|uniref:Uncharacterized protein n=1 Tax=Streptomyces alboflavus TaxID=67267 RepID=A0A1Z1W523_9ACTN|nr:hypothetical protein SMD44_00941 [Streptomyces alboflavus]